MRGATLGLIFAVAALAAPLARARADDDALRDFPDLAASPLRVDASPVLRFSPEPPAAPDANAALPPPAERHRFGERGTQWLTLGTGIAWDFDEAYDINFPRLAYSYFIAEDVELSLELNGWRFIQQGDDAWGINPVMIFRWHFINSGSWSAYADAGVGILVATSKVPDGGTNVDFTPRVGVGVTKQLTDGGLRGQLGLRWHHISNARISGDRDNPSRDALMVYGGLVFPF